MILVFRGRMSTFGGPADTGVTPSEGLALFADRDLRIPAHTKLFLPKQPPKTTGLARRLNPEGLYVACRWNYAETSKAYLRGIDVLVTNPRTGKSMRARPADWGPAKWTRRIADLSPGLARALELETDDECVVEIPIEEVRA